MDQHNSNGSADFCLNGQTLGVVPTGQPDTESSTEYQRHEAGQINSVPIQLTYYHRENVLHAISGEFAPVHYEQILSSFVTQYGQPGNLDDSKETIYSGVEVNNKRAWWDSGGWQLRIEQYGLTKTSGLFFVCTRQWIEQMADMSSDVSGEESLDTVPENA